MAGFWHDENTERARKLWNSGMSAQAVAEAIGADSRNCVIGKAHREGWGRAAGRTEMNGPSGSRPISANSPKAQRAKRIKVIARSLAPERAVKWTPAKRAVGDAVARLTPPRPVGRDSAVVQCAPMAEPKILADLSRRQCHWPLDDPGSGQMHRTLFCAARVEGEDEERYCPHHMAMSYAGKRYAGKARPTDRKVA